jgi:hypothetical protein
VSVQVQLVVTCERCGKTSTVEDPVTPALRHAKAVNANAHGPSLELHQLHARPDGWGVVEWKRADAHRTATRELCGECMDVIEEATQPSELRMGKGR